MKFHICTISFNAFRVYSKEKSIGSYWIGVKNRNGDWETTDGHLLSNLDVNVTGSWSDGDCIIADASADYQHKVVSCELKFSVKHIPLH